MKVSHDRTLHVAFDGGVHLNVDLSKVRMSTEQREIVSKLASKLPEIPAAECKDGHCPAQSVLSPEEFSKIRNLKVAIGTGGREMDAGPLIDSCVHVVNVASLAGNIGPETERV